MDAQHEKEDNHWVVEYIKHGQTDRSRLLHMVLGFYLHWRTWALMLVIFFPYAAAFVMYDRYGAVAGIMVAIFTGLLAGGWALKVSPKYNVTQNY